MFRVRYKAFTSGSYASYTFDKTCGALWPEEGDIENGKHFTGGRWRTVSEIQEMALISVEASLAEGPCTLLFLVRTSGLADINAQLFVTSVDREALVMFFDTVDTRLFHVKQGCISTYEA